MTIGLQVSILTVKDVEREFATAYNIITRDERLEIIANDLVKHFMGREPFTSGVSGKAMVVNQIVSYYF